MASISILSSLNHHPLLLSSPQLFATKTNPRIRISLTKPHKKPPSLPPFVCNFRAFSRRLEASSSSECSVISSGYLPKSRESVIQCVAKQIVYSLFCFILIGFCPVGSIQKRAIAAPVATEERLNERERDDVVLRSKDHLYSDYTRKLLETVSGLLSCIEEVRRGNGDEDKVGLGLNAVKEKKSELQNEIMSGMYREVKELKREKEGLEKRADQLVEEAAKAKGEHEGLAAKAGKVKERVERLEERMKELDEQYEEVWERIGEIDDEITRKEALVMSVGVRELSFIERECEELVKGFRREMRQKKIRGR